MAEEFYRTSMPDEAFLRNPGRILYADMSTGVPSGIGDIINLSTMQAGSGWVDVGPTKGGATVNFNNSEETFDIDQVVGDIYALPTNAEMSVATAIGQSTLDWLAFAWEGDAPTINTRPVVPEKIIHIGTFETYTQRRLALGARRPRSGKLRFFFFHIAQRSPQEASLAFNKEGDQQSIAYTWRILPDTSIADPRRRFMIAFDQQ